MIIKFLPHGKGDPFRAAAYVMDDKDHLNLPRTGVEVLRGDPMTFASIAQSSPHKYRYTSVVIAWAAEDEVGIDEINEVLDAFEQHAFAGLKPHQYHMTAVMHEEENRSRHIHVLIPRLELSTEKSLNIAPPGHRHYFDPLRDYFNHKYDWARPDDPARARSLQLQHHELKQNMAALRANLIEQPKATRIELINQFIEHRILQGVVYDRPTVLQALSEIGTITRVGQNYISLRTEAGTDRLKAAYYDEQFYLSDYLEDQRRRDTLGSPSIEDSTKLAERNRALREAEQRIQDVRAKRQQYNERTYQDSEPLSAAIGHDQRSTYAVESAVEEVTTLQDPSRGGERTAEQSDGGNTLTDEKPPTNPFGDIADVRKSPENAFQFFDLKRITTQRDQSTTQDEARSQHNRGDSAGHRQNTYLYFTAIADTDLQQQSHFNLQQHKRYLNARIPYRVTTPDSATTSVVTTRKSSFEKLFANDDGRDQRSQQYHRIAASLSRQIATIDRTIEQRATAQGSADPTVSELFIQQHRTSRARKLVQSIGAIIGKVSGFLSKLGFIPRTDRAAGRSKTREIFEHFRTVTSDQLGRVIYSRKKHRARVRQSVERGNEFNERFKGINPFISEVLDWSKKHVFPDKTLDSFIDKIHQRQPKDRQLAFFSPRMHAENMDKQLRLQIKNLINNQEQYGLHFPFVSDFKQCISGLRTTMHLLEKNDYPHIYDFLTTMDRYMQMIQLNYKHADLDPAHRKMKSEVGGTVEEFKIKLERSEIEKGFKESPLVTTSKNERPKQDLVKELVPEKPKIKTDNSRDFEM